MKFKIILCAPLFCVFSSGCMTMNSQFASSEVSKIYTQRTSADQIELFRSQAPTRKYTEIGSANACCSLNTDALVEGLREQASRSGGDALIDLDVEPTGGATASVIRYLD